MIHDARKLVLNCMALKGFVLFVLIHGFLYFSCVHILVRNAFILIESVMRSSMFYL